MDNDLKRQKIKEDIFMYLKQGMYKKDSAIMAGIDESTLYRWISDDASFASQVEAKILEYKRSLIQTLTKHAETNGTLALQILRTRWPREWAKPQYETDDKNDIKSIATIMDAIIAGWHPEQTKDNEILPEQFS